MDKSPNNYEWNPNYYNSHESLDSFTEFMKLHPDLRFWQALRSWAKVDKILIERDHDQEDTFYW